MTVETSKSFCDAFANIILIGLACFAIANGIREFFRVAKARRKYGRIKRYAK